MDIAFITTRLTEKDAQGNFSAATLTALKDRGHDVRLYTFAYERPQIDSVEVNYLGGENRHSIKSNIQSFLKTLSTADRLSRSNKILLVGPDIGAIPAAHLAKKHNKNAKLIWVYHGLTPEEYLSSTKDKWLSKIRRKVYLWSMKRSDVVQVYSNHIKEELIESGISDGSIIVMRLGIDLSRFSSGNRDGVRSKLNFENRFIMLYVGRLARLKRVDELISALSMMKSCNVGLVIIGSGPEIYNLKKLSRELGVEDLVKFAGAVSDEELPDYYAACDVWVTASRHEGFCVPIIEAMACGKPVIVPMIAAMPETAGDAGLTYDAGNPEQLTDNIKKLMLDKDLYESLSDRAASRAMLYEISGVLDRYVDSIMS